jgi:hypothetical protein
MDKIRQVVEFYLVDMETGESLTLQAGEEVTFTWDQQGVIRIENERSSE